MGMGEPLDNFDEVMDFIRIANEDLGIGQRHITLSTCRLVPGIERLADKNLRSTWRSRFTRRSAGDETRPDHAGRPRVPDPAAHRGL